MSTTPNDFTQYYPSYVNPEPHLTPEQLQLIHASWQQLKDGQYEAF